MLQHRMATRLVAIALIVLLSAPLLPVHAGTARIRGTVLTAGEEAPLSGVKVLAADPETGRIFQSTATGETGAFEIGELPAGSFELAVATGTELYVVSHPLSLDATEERRVNLALRQGEGGGGAAGSAAGTSAVWNNPATAALIVVGGALVVGAVVNAAVDDDDDPATASGF